MMPEYIRKWKDRTILVRPTKWDKAKELPPWDCLDITVARKQYLKYLVSNTDLEHPIVAEIRKNYSLYRSRPFCKKYADNPRMNNPFFGCCTPASEAVYFLTPEYREPLCYRAADGEGIYHWWVQSFHHYEDTLGDGIYPGIKDQVVIQDATAEQFDGLSFDPPYENGKKTTLLGWKKSPSKRTLDLIANTSMKSIRYKSFDNFYMPPIMDDSYGTLEEFLD
jgi:hypothetical protein